MPTGSPPGRSLVTRRAIVDLVRNATLGSYGVLGFAASPMERLRSRVGGGQPGISIELDDGRLVVAIDLAVAHGVPVAEVARQVDANVRYAVQRSLGVEIGRLTIHVAGVRVRPAAPSPRRRASPTAIHPGDLADSGSDVA